VTRDGAAAWRGRSDAGVQCLKICRKKGVAKARRLLLDKTSADRCASLRNPTPQKQTGV
jgi:hypothetical protein